jgi:hypothetical protein
VLSEKQISEWIAYRYLEPNYGAGGMLGGMAQPEQKQAPEDQERMLKLWARGWKQAIEQKEELNVSKRG